MSAGKLKYTLVVRHPETLLPEALLAGTDLPAWAEDLVDEGNLEGGSDSGSKGSDDDKGYGGLKVDELKAEIEKRNEDRDDDAKLSAEGKKADLVAVLEADDAAGV